MDESSSREKAIAIMPKFSAFASIIGSAFIIYDILCSHFNVQPDWWRKKSEKESSSAGFSRGAAMTSARARSSRRFGERKTLANSAYYRLMLSMSTSDFIVSFAWFCTTWPIPRDDLVLDNPSEKIYGNIGTPQTCTAQAFFIQLGIVTPFYNALLASYYYLTIRREWKEDDFMKRVEFFGHFVALAFGFGTSIAGLAMEIYNNSVVWCWIAPYPSGCGNGEGQTPCVRGGQAKALRWIFYYGPLWANIFLVAFFMSLVYFYVRGLDVKMNKYTKTYRDNAARMSAASATNGEESSEHVTDGRRPSFLVRSFSTTKMEQIKEQRKQRKNERSKAVANQGLFYAGTFALVWVFGTIVRAMQLAGAPPPWAIIFLFAVFTPSQGFFNFLVYVRPRVIKYYQQRKKRSSATSCNESLSSNALHVSGLSLKDSSTEQKNQDTSTNSEIKLTDPFMKSTPEDNETDTNEPSTVKSIPDSTTDTAVSE